MKSSLKLALTILVILLAVPLLGHFFDWMNLPSVEWKRLENQRAFIDRWNGELPHTVLGDKTGLMMPMPSETK